MSPLTPLDDRAFRRFESNLELLRQSLDKSHGVKERMVGILDRFEDRFGVLERQMTEMSERVDTLKVAHDNIDATIKAIDTVLGRFNVPIAVEKRIDEGVKDDLNSYMKAIDRANEAAAFFSKHSNYRGADKLFIQLNTLKYKAIYHLENEFKRVITVSSKKEIDPYVLAIQESTVTTAAASQTAVDGDDSTPAASAAVSIVAPGTYPTYFQDFDMISAETLEVLGRIAKRLDAMNAIAYRKTWKDVRSRVIRLALDKIYPEKKQKKDKKVTPGGPSSGAAYSTAAGKSAAASSASKSANNADKNAQDAAANADDGIGDEYLSRANDFYAALADTSSSGRFYQRGSHRFLFYTHFYLRLLEEEKELAYTVIAGPEVGSIFGEVISASMKVYLERANSLAEKKSEDQIFILLDIISNFEDKLKSRFSDVLSNNSDMMYELEALLKMFKESVSKMLEEKKVEIETNNSNVFKEGIVHEATSSAFVFFRRLLEYRELVEDLLKSYFFSTEERAFSAKKQKDYNTFIGRYIKYILNAIEYNIEQKAKMYKDDSLKAIFMLNNHHHILKKLKSNEFKNELNETILSGFLTKVQQDQEAYLVATWGAALENMTKDVSKKILRDKKGEYTKSTKKEIKARLKSFNNAFNEIHTKHRMFSIPDVELREQMRQRSVETVVKPYETFVAYYCKGPNNAFSRKPGKYVQYDGSTMTDLLSQLFDEQGSA